MKAPLLSLLSLMAFQSSAWADLYAHGEYQISDYGAYVADHYDLREGSSGYISNGDNQHFEVGSVLEGVGGNAFASSYASYGVLWARSQATSSMTALIPGTPGDQIEAAYIAMQTTGSGSSAEAIFSDTLNFYGLPVGTPVTVRVTAYLHDYISLGGSYAMRSGIGTSAFVMELASISGQSVQIEDTDATQGTHVHSSTLLGEGFVGQPFAISDALETLSIASPSSTVCALDPNYCNDNDIHVTADTNAHDTALLAIEVLTPGAFYTADSGTVYATTIPVVPEPGTPELLTIGFLALVPLGLCRSRGGNRAGGLLSGPAHKE